MKKIIAAAVAVILLAWLAAAFFISSGDEGEAVQVEVQEVKRTARLVSTVSASGEIQPKEFVELQSEITGIITEVFVKEGDVVHKGDLLLKINPTQLELATVAERAAYEMALADAAHQKAQIRVQESMVSRDRASLRQAEAQLGEARQRFRTAEARFERKQQMHEDDLISRDEYDQAKNDLLAAETSLQSAEAGLEQAEAQLAVSQLALEQARIQHENTLTRARQTKANLQRQEDELAKTTIRSPLGGVITQMNVESGERAVPGTLNNPSATLMVIADLSVIEAEIKVDETDIVHVEPGQSAVIEVDAMPGKPQKGRVTEVGSSAIQSQGEEAKDFKVVVQLEDPPASLRPGLSCSADITTAVREDVITIPIQALVLREVENPATDSSQDGDDASNRKIEKEGVFRVADGKAEFAPVETGVTGETKIEVKSGLNEGDRIVVGSYKALRELNDGDPVKTED